MFAVMEKVRRASRTADEHASIALRLGDSEYDARKVRARALLDELTKIREEMEA